MISDVECQVLDEEVVGYESIFSELNLKRHTILRKVSLVVAEIGGSPAAWISRFCSTGGRVSVFRMSFSLFVTQ